MPSAPSAHLGLTGPLGPEAPNGAANIATLIAQLEAAVGLVKLAELSPSSGSISFTAINANFRHLRVAGVVRGDVAGALALRLNGSSAAEYDVRRHESGGGNGADGLAITTAGAAAQTSASLGTMLDESDVTYATNGMQSVALDVLNYTGSRWKLWHYKGAYSASLSGSPGVKMIDAAGTWRNTAAVTAVQLFNAAGGLDAGSLLTLYGVR